MFKSLPLSALTWLSLFLAGLTLWPTRVTSQEKTTLPNFLPHSHAHNDYEHAHPLVDSLNFGFASIEADVWLVDGNLCVAHNRSDVQTSKRLDNLYLEPLFKLFNANGNKIFANGETLFLLVDFKSEGEATYQALKQLLNKYRPMVNAPAGTTPAVKIIISGNRPIETIKNDADRCVGVDGRLSDLKGPFDASLMPLISDNWRLHFRYQGNGEISAEERLKLKAIVQQVHQNGAQLRFWATPENDMLWKTLREAEVDLIGTDQREKLVAFLKSQAGT